jgi:calcineurin-like phosphoesterase family protein
MTTWFTSDLHLGHANIIRYCHRPFADVAEMDDALRYNWASRVAADDLVYVLGDVSFHGADWTQHLVEKLPGKKVLIAGNHDSSKVRKLPCWDVLHTGIESGRELVVLDLPGGPELGVAFCHYPPHYNGLQPSRWYLHGHVHGTKACDGQHPVYDVGVDANDYAPVAWETIREALTKCV